MLGVDLYLFHKKCPVFIEILIYSFMRARSNCLVSFFVSVFNIIWRLIFSHFSTKVNDGCNKTSCKYSSTQLFHMSFCMSWAIYIAMKPSKFFGKPLKQQTLAQWLSHMATWDAVLTSWFDETFHARHAFYLTTFVTSQSITIPSE